MAGNRRCLAPAATAKEETSDEPKPVISESELHRLKLRQRWELASVLNFLNVFEPVIQINVKMSAEDIETGLIEPNKSLAQLHIALLKGLLPVNKALNTADAWVAVLSKKLAMWWRWVAEGDFPLNAAKGEEISRYKELDPTVRLMILKALCEIRADQHDIVVYINDAIKNGTEVSTFRKDRIGGDGNGAAYWLVSLYLDLTNDRDHFGKSYTVCIRYDGTAVIGHRLYREVTKFDVKAKVKGKGSLSIVHSKWETLATNLEEFREIMDQYSSSKVQLEVAVSKAVGADAIPALEKLQKKKERALKQRQRYERLLNGFRQSGITRTCRNRNPVRYTFDEYDKAIDEALQLILPVLTFVARRRKTTEQSHVEKHSKHIRSNEAASNGGSDQGTRSIDSKSTAYETDSGDEYDGKNDKTNEDRSGSNRAFQKQTDAIPHRPWGSRWSMRVAGTAGHYLPEGRNVVAKNRLRQRPTHNTAIESAVVPDSEDDPENTGDGVGGCENLSPDDYSD
ncbi:hypothetical protein RJ639_025175, partial [Escallonia herrerae]